MDEDGPRTTERRKKSTSAHDADVLLKLIRRLGDEGISLRNVTVGNISVEIAPQRPQVHVQQPQERLASTYAQRELDKLGKRLAREGGLKE